MLMRDGARARPSRARAPRARPSPRAALEPPRLAPSPRRVALAPNAPEGPTPSPGAAAATRPSRRRPPRSEPDPSLPPTRAPPPRLLTHRPSPTTLLPLSAAAPMPPEHHAAFREGLLGCSRDGPRSSSRWRTSGAARFAQKFAARARNCASGSWAPRKHPRWLRIWRSSSEILGDDFCVQCEDGSPREVARIACDMYERCRVGDYSVAADVCAKPLPRESVENSRRVEEDRRWTAGAAGAAGAGGGSDDDGGSEEDAEAMDADDLAAGLGEFSMREGGDAGADGAGRRRNPEPDEDGWCTVPTRKR